MVATAAEILVVEDDPQLVEVLTERLSREGFVVRSAMDGNQALQSALQSPPSLILLDLMLPGMRGFELCRKLKEDPRTKNTPVIMVTANSEEVDVVVGFEVGAEDYVTKPFSIRQLVARIRAVLRRCSLDSREGGAGLPRLGLLTYDKEGWDVRLEDKSLGLTGAEFRLFSVLFDKAGLVVPREELLQLLSKDGAELVDRNVDVHIGSLRRKMGRYAKVIVTVRGIGYKCLPEDQIHI